MKINLFGGRQGPPISEYFKDTERNIRGLINTLKHQQLHPDEIRKRVIETFTITPINIDYSNKVLRVLNEKKGIQPVDGYPREVIIATYRLEIPFTGERVIMEHMPIDDAGNAIFHGTPKVVDVIEKNIITTFEARKDYQQQIENFSHESIGDCYRNQSSMNIAINKWNDSLSKIDLQ